MPAQFGLMVPDQLPAYVHGYFVNLTGEWERRLILRCYRRAHVRAAVDGAEQSDAERIGQRDVALSDLLAIDVRDPQSLSEKTNFGINEQVNRRERKWRLRNTNQAPRFPA